MLSDFLSKNQVGSGHHWYARRIREDSHGRGYNRNGGDRPHIQIINKKAADILFIKLAKVGGILNVKKWVSIAEAADLPVMCGCMGGSGFEAAHQGHFLAASKWMGRLEQENLGPMLLHNTYNTAMPTITDDLSINMPGYEGGCFYPPDGPGLGVDLNEEVLNKIITPGKSPIIVTG